jgi:hypothetical protein
MRDFLTERQPGTILEPIWADRRLLQRSTVRFWRAVQDSDENYVYAIALLRGRFETPRAIRWSRVGRFKMVNFLPVNWLMSRGIAAFREFRNGL